jgi:hypothetical protein
VRPIDPDSQPWHFVPANPEAEVRFRRWNLVIIFLLGMLVLGLFLTVVVPKPGTDTSFASKTPAKASTTHRP